MLFIQDREVKIFSVNFTRLVILCFFRWREKPTLPKGH